MKKDSIVLALVGEGAAVVVEEQARGPLHQNAEQSDQEKREPVSHYKTPEAPGCDPL